MTLAPRDEPGRPVSAAPILTCPHKAVTLYHPIKLRALKADCGNRACDAARKRWALNLRRRILRAPLIPGQPLTLWTITARTFDQDRLYQAERERRQRHSCEPQRYAINSRDRGDPGQISNLLELSKGVSRLIQAVRRQARRQRSAGYPRRRCAGCIDHASLPAGHRERYYVRGHPWAELRLISVIESGELNGRIHAHVISNYQYIDHVWLSEHARRCGLGFIQFEAPQKSWARGRGGARAIGSYISKYLSKPGKSWPFPRSARIYNTLRSWLPPHAAEPGWIPRGESVAYVVAHFLTGEVIDPAATYYEAAAP